MRCAIATTAVLLLGLPIPAAARHGAVLIDARRATPGVRLELVEVPAVAPWGPLRYELHASGVPANVVFSIWTREFGGTFEETLRRFRLDETGILVGLDKAGNVQPIDNVTGA
jgi:hypothetical protein